MSELQQITLQNNAKAKQPLKNKFYKMHNTAWPMCNTLKQLSMSRHKTRRMAPSQLGTLTLLQAGHSSISS